MAGGRSAINGPKLAKLLRDDGWTAGRENSHGVSYWKKFGDTTRITTIQTETSSIPTSTLQKILGPLQTGLGRKGFLRLMAGDTEKARARKAKRAAAEE